MRRMWMENVRRNKSPLGRCRSQEAEEVNVEEKGKGQKGEHISPLIVKQVSKFLDKVSQQKVREGEGLFMWKMEAQGPNYWKEICNTLETENKSLRKKIKLVVRLIRQQNKKLKRFEKSPMDNSSGSRSSSGGRRKERERQHRQKKHRQTDGHDDNGMGPGDAQTQAPRYAFQILHEELWVLILDEYVRKPEEILKMCRVSSQINGIYCETKWRLAFDKAFPAVLKHLDQQDLLNLRLICKKWRNVVDTMLESHHDSFTLCHNTDLEIFEPAKGFQYPVWRKEQGPVQILGIPKITKLIQELEERRTRNGEAEDVNNYSNPFVGRAVHFSPRTSEADENSTVSGEVVSEYWQYLLELLTLYGKQIHQLHISIGNAEMQSLVFYRHLRVCLDLVPNLRALKLEGTLRQPRNTYCELRLRIFRETHKLPELPNLKCMDINSRLELWVDRVDGIRSYHEEKHVVLNQLVLQTYAPQTETLFYRGKPINPNSVTEYPQQLPNVKELNAICSDSVGVMFLLREVRLQQLNTLRVYIPQGCYVLRELFLLLQRCPQLSRLELGETQLLLTDDLPQLEPAPAVRHLTVGHSVHVSYNYLVCLPSLEYLGICVSPMTPEQDYLDTRENHNEVVKIRKYLKGRNSTMYKSNVWQLLPKLKEVDIFKNPGGTWRHFTRQQFEMYFQEKQDIQVDFLP